MRSFLTQNCYPYQPKYPPTQQSSGNAAGGAGLRRIPAVKTQRLVINLKIKIIG